MPRSRCRIKRDALSSGVENITKTAVPSRPDTARVSTMRSRAAAICFW